MNLRDARRSQGRLVEFRKDVLEGLAAIQQLLRHDGAGEFGGHRIEVVGEPRQGLGVLLGEEILPRRYDLGRLDVKSLERCDGRRQLGRSPLVLLVPQLLPLGVRHGLPQELLPHEQFARYSVVRSDDGEGRRPEFRRALEAIDGGGCRRELHLHLGLDGGASAVDAFVAVVSSVRGPPNEGSRRVRRGGHGRCSDQPAPPAACAAGYSRRRETVDEADADADEGGGKDDGGRELKHHLSLFRQTPFR
mmetsp:Transcript_38943/g.117136  ORF Transcript_38943/g.117136 Transcript_38943/m.117136 type:complete len:248 (+) Transcript_38943:1407-2150(+)